MQAGIDARVPEALVPDLLQVVREALSNVAEHTEAASVTVAAHDAAYEVDSAPGTGTTVRVRVPLGGR